MARQFTMTLDVTATSVGSNKLAVVSSDTPAEVTANQISVIITDTVDVSRRVEIINGWKWLAAGMNERSILLQFKDIPVYSAVPVGNRSSVARKTSSTPIPIVNGDIAIGVGAAIATDQDWTVMIESAFTQLIDAANEDWEW
jgi:hypothetical protein